MLQMLYTDVWSEPSSQSMVSSYILENITIFSQSFLTCVHNIGPDPGPSSITSVPPQQHKRDGKAEEAG